MCVCTFDLDAVCCFDLLCNMGITSELSLPVISGYVAIAGMLDKYAVFVCVVQVTSHAAAAQSATLVFVCIHREHYDFLETLAPQLKGKVPCCTVRCLCVTKQLLKF